MDILLNVINMKTKQFAITMLFCIALANMGCGGKSGKTGGKSGKVDTTVVDTTIETSEAKCDTVAVDAGLVIAFSIFPNP